MAYGLEVIDIISAFSGATESDFATASLSGSEVIINEINTQWLKLKSLLKHPLTDHVENEVVNVMSDYSFKTHYVPVDNTLKITGNVNDCVPENHCHCTYNYESNSAVLSGANVCGNYIVSYDVDPSDQYHAKFILRDLVCSSLGNRIYLQGNAEVASIVTFYNDQANNWIKLLQDGFCPFPKRPTRGITSIRATRS